MSTPARGHTYRRAGSERSGPADRRRQSLRVYTVCAVLAAAAAALYGNSVGNRQPDAGAVNGVLDAFDDAESRPSRTRP